MKTFIALNNEQNTVITNKNSLLQETTDKYLLIRYLHSATGLSRGLKRVHPGRSSLGLYPISAHFDAHKIYRNTNFVLKFLQNILRSLSS